MSNRLVDDPKLGKYFEAIALLGNLEDEPLIEMLALAMVHSRPNGVGEDELLRFIQWGHKWRSDATLLFLVVNGEVEVSCPDAEPMFRARQPAKAAPPPKPARIPKPAKAVALPAPLEPPITPAKAALVPSVDLDADRIAAWLVQQGPHVEHEIAAGLGSDTVQVGAMLRRDLRFSCTTVWNEKRQSENLWSAE